MGDPKVQGSGGGFITRLGRAIDAFGADAPKTKKTASKAPVEVAQPLPKKYKSPPRRLDRSVVSAPVSDSAAYKIWENETYVAKALKLVDDMRALAAKEDHWYNKTTPKDVDRVVNKYRPLIMVATDSHQKRQLAELMLKELYDTSTADNLFWEVGSHPAPIDIKDLKDLERRSTVELMALMEESDRMKAVEPYQCYEEAIPSKETFDESCTSGTAITCEIGGHKKTKSNVSCKSSKGSGDRPSAQDYRKGY